MDETMDGRALIELAMADPAAAIAAGERSLESEQPADERILTLRALGIARTRQGAYGDARELLERAMTKAQSHGLEELTHECALSLATANLFEGSIEVALSSLREVIDGSSGRVKAEALFQLGTSHAQLGNFELALDSYGQALPALREFGLVNIEAQLLGNRALIHHLSTDYTAALVDFERAGELYDELDDRMSGLYNCTNRAMTLFRLGDIPSALALFDEAQPRFVEVGVDPATVSSDRCEMLMAAGLFEDALHYARESAVFYDATGNELYRIEALVFASEAALALGNTALTLDLVRRVRAIEGASDFSAMRARAEVAAIHARSLAGDASDQDLERVIALGDEMERAGQPAAALDALVHGAQLAAARGNWALASSLIDKTARRSQQAPLDVRARRWSVVARLRLRSGTLRGVSRAITAGTDAVVELRSTTGSFELRSRSTAQAASLLEVAAMAFRDKPGRIVSVAEALRSGALEFGVATESAELRDALADLRQRETQVRSGDASLRSLTEAQAAVRRLTHHSRSKPAPVAQPAAVEADEAVITYVTSEQRVVRIVQSHDGERLFDCGPIDAITSAIEEQRFCTRQLARRRVLNAATVSSLNEQFERVSNYLAHALVGSLEVERIVINPPADLDGAIWSGLPGLFERAHCVAPSLALARRPLPALVKDPLVAGSSDLGHVPEELRRIAQVHDVEPRLDPGNAEPFDQAHDLWHLAGHLLQNGQNPLLSSLPLGSVVIDGYEVLHRRRVPHIAVLSACSSGESDAGPAGIGLAAAFLAAGTASVICSYAPLEDSADVVDFMVSVHSKLATGLSPAVALQSARASAPAADRALVATLSVRGAGW